MNTSEISLLPPNARELQRKFRISPRKKLQPFFFFFSLLFNSLGTCARLLWEFGCRPISRHKRKIIEILNMMWWCSSKCAAESWPTFSHQHVWGSSSYSDFSSQQCFQIPATCVALAKLLKLCLHLKAVAVETFILGQPWGYATCSGLVYYLL